MSYSVEYINCRVCASDAPKFLGIRGNLEYAQAPALPEGQDHLVTNVVKCRNCGFIYTNPLIISPAVKGYDQPLSYRPSVSHAKVNFLFGSILRLVGRYATKGNILDLGCGRGEFLALAREGGWSAYGVESSAEMADYARRTHTLDVRLKNLADAGFAASFFDAVTLNMALEHLDNPRSLINQIHRILKKKGIIFIEVPNMESLTLWLAGLYFKLRGRDWSALLSPLHYPYHSYGYSVRPLKYLLESCGFRIKKIIIGNLGARGIRSGDGNNLERLLFRIASSIAAFFGRGDVLMVIAVKKDEVQG